MPLVKHEYPIMEYDTEKTAVLEPDRKTNFRLPSKCVYGFLGDYIKDYALEHNLEIIAEYRSMMKMNAVYKIVKDGKEIVLCSAPLGASASTAILDWLICHGVSEIIAIYRETKDMVNYRKSEGCAAVEMECSALASCARFRGAVFGQILFTQDSLADADMHDDRNWGADSFDKAVAIALEAVCRI